MDNACNDRFIDSSISQDKKIELLVEKYSDQLYRTAYFQCKNRHDAEDIVQEVFIKYMKKKPSFVDEDHERAWFLRTTINLSKDYFKSFWNRKTQAIFDNIPYYMEENNDLLNMIYELPYKYRVVIQLYYMEGYSLEEISEILHKNLSTVKTRVRRAKELLKKRREDHG